MAPMMWELTARPAHPQVMTMPMAVEVMRGKASATMASVVGKDGSHGESGEKDEDGGGTRFVGPQHEESCNSHGYRSGQRDVDRRNADEDGRDGDAADEQAERESQGKDVEGARFGDALRDEVADEPVPDADFAAHVEEEQESEEKEGGAAEDGTCIRKDEAACTGGRRHVGGDLDGKGRRR